VIWLAVGAILFGAALLAAVCLPEIIDWALYMRGCWARWLDK